VKTASFPFCNSSRHRNRFPQCAIGRCRSQATHTTPTRGSSFEPSFTAGNLSSVSTFVQINLKKELSWYRRPSRTDTQFILLVIHVLTLQLQAAAHGHGKIHKFTSPVRSRGPTRLLWDVFDDKNFITWLALGKYNIVELNIVELKESGLQIFNPTRSVRMQMPGRSTSSCSRDCVY
jgi:hypothetical protein